MTREDYGYMLEAINDMEWDDISEAAEDYAEYEFGTGDVQEVDTSDITATVWSVNGIRDGDEPPVLDETVKGKDGKDLNLHIDMTHGYPEIVGSIEMNRSKVDGIILTSVYPCGPDSMVNEMITRRVKDTPILNLVLDAQTGTAGLETRLESFIDILKLKKEAEAGE